MNDILQMILGMALMLYIIDTLMRLGD